MTYIEKSIAVAVLMAAASSIAGQPVEVEQHPIFVQKALAGQPVEVEQHPIFVQSQQPGGIAIYPSMEAAMTNFPDLKPFKPAKKPDLSHLDDFDRAYYERHLEDPGWEPAVLIYIDDDYGNKVQLSYWQYLDYLKYKDSEHPYSDYLIHSLSAVGTNSANPPVLYDMTSPKSPIRIKASSGSDTQVSLDPRAAYEYSQQQGWPTWKTALVVGGCVVLTAGLIYAIVEAVDHGGGHNSSSDRNPNVVIDGDNNNVTVRDGSDNNQTTKNDYGYGY